MRESARSRKTRGNFKSFLFLPFLFTVFPCSCVDSLQAQRTPKKVDNEVEYFSIILNEVADSASIIDFFFALLLLLTLTLYSLGIFYLITLADFEQISIWIFSLF